MIHASCTRYCAARNTAIEAIRKSHNAPSCAFSSISANLSIAHPCYAATAVSEPRSRMIIRICVADTKSFKKPES